MSGFVAVDPMPESPDPATVFVLKEASSDDLWDMFNALIAKVERDNKPEDRARFRLLWEEMINRNIALTTSEN